MGNVSELHRTYYPSRSTDRIQNPDAFSPISPTLLSGSRPSQVQPRSLIHSSAEMERPRAVRLAIGASDAVYAAATLDVLSYQMI